MAWVTIMIIFVALVENKCKVSFFVKIKILINLLSMLDFLIRWDSSLAYAYAYADILPPSRNIIVWTRVLRN